VPPNGPYPYSPREKASWVDVWPESETPEEAESTGASLWNSGRKVLTLARTGLLGATRPEPDPEDRTLRPEELGNLSREEAAPEDYQDSIISWAKSLVTVEDKANDDEEEAARALHAVRQKNTSSARRAKHHAAASHGQTFDASDAKQKLGQRVHSHFAQKLRHS
jgi:hypothetical protein